MPTLEALLASRHRSCGVVTQPDRPRGRGQKVTDAPVKALGAGSTAFRVLQPERLAIRTSPTTLRAWQPDLGVVAAYGKLIPEDLLALPRLGMINVHASLLPKYRGAAPVHRAVIDGEHETGVTIMRVEKCSTPATCSARSRGRSGPTKPAMSSSAISPGSAPSLLVDVVEQLAAGTAHEEPQDFTLCTYAPRLTKEEGLVDWTLPASYIHNRVRGLYPWPHAYTYLDGARIILLQDAGRDGDHRRRSRARSSTSPATRIHVATGHGERIAISELQPEGRRPMAAREFLAGHPSPAGRAFHEPMTAPAPYGGVSRAPRDCRRNVPTCRRRWRRAVGICPTTATARWPRKSSPARCAGSAASTTSSSTSRRGRSRRSTPTSCTSCD